MNRRRDPRRGIRGARGGFPLGVRALLALLILVSACASVSPEASLRRQEQELLAQHGNDIRRVALQAALGEQAGPLEIAHIRLVTAEAESASFQARVDGSASSCFYNVDGELDEEEWTWSAQTPALGCRF